MITGLSQAKISLHGSKLSVLGKGFGYDSSKIAVSVAGHSCNIKNVSNTEIHLEMDSLSNKTLSNGTFLGGSGLDYTRYNLTGMNI